MVMRRQLIVLGVLLLTLLWGPPVCAAALSPAEATVRLETIVAQMRRLRFCSRDSCRYRELSYSLSARPDGAYQASINAVIDRPSTVIDTGRYELVLSDGRWQLVGGEELTDVSSFNFQGDRYEIESVYSNRSATGRLTPERADSNILSGYRALYYEVLQNGIERLQSPYSSSANTESVADEVNPSDSG